MSGTSLDAVDGVLARFFDAGREREGPACRAQVLAHASVDLPPALRNELLALNRAGENELERGALAANDLVALYATVVADLLRVSGVDREQVQAIGAHGQTVRHRPDLGYTVQLNAPARLAETTGIAVVADFRSRDVAAGGQGAPLVPAFHQAIFGNARPRAVLNLGGIANLSLLGKATLGFDTGPANVLLDLWCQRHTGMPYDRDGGFAASGRVDAGLLAYLCASEPWLALSPPKSTGRDLFHAGWLDSRLEQYCTSDNTTLSPQDVQATLTAFTARTVADALREHASAARELFVCGGGAHNGELMRMLAAELPGCAVATTDTLDVPPQQVEALAFAWLARAYMESHPGNVPAVTGARGLRILGAFYPA